MAARWRIVEGPNLSEDEQGIDGELWVATVERMEDDPARRHVVSVVIARTARDSDPRTLPLEVRRALETHATSAVERTLNDWRPPDRIFISTDGITTE